MIYVMSFNEISYIELCIARRKLVLFNISPTSSPINGLEARILKSKYLLFIYFNWNKDCFSIFNRIYIKHIMYNAYDISRDIYYNRMNSNKTVITAISQLHINEKKLFLEVLLESMLLRNWWCYVFQLTFNFRRALNRFKQSTVSWRCIVAAYRSRC